MSPSRWGVLHTVGVSPKVTLPVGAQLVAGVALLIAGEGEAGRTAIATALGTAGIGYAAKPGAVTEVAQDIPPDEDSDSPEAA